MRHLLTGFLAVAGVLGFGIVVLLGLALLSDQACPDQAEDWEHCRRGMFLPEDLLNE